MIFLAGMGRSGTTWAADIINLDNQFRVLFEPFHPLKVPESKQFEYIQYMHPENHNPTLINQARLILSGQVRTPWTDVGAKSIPDNLPILIKDIRCNLMLGWLKKIAPEFKFVLMIRHPLQVVDSWRKLGWGIESDGEPRYLEIILSQQALLDDHPILSEVAQTINLEDFLERTVFLWGLNYYVPLMQLSQRETFILFYENLVTNPQAEARELMQFLERPFDFEKIAHFIGKFSTTNFRKRDDDTDRLQLVRGWRDNFSMAQINKAQEILEVLGLANIYDMQGQPEQSKIRCWPPSCRNP